MKKKLIRIANQIYIVENKLQNGENMQENFEKLENLTKNLSENEIWEINEYLEEKFQIKFKSK